MHVGRRIVQYLRASALELPAQVPAIGAEFTEIRYNDVSDYTCTS